MKLYHYTNSSAYKSMKNREFLDGNGLRPRKRFTPFDEYDDLPEEAYYPASFFFLDPEPDSWLDNQEFPNIWEKLTKHICVRCMESKDNEIVLLSFDVKPEDEAYVIDRALIESAIRRNENRILSGEEERDAIEAYINSKVPLSEYEGSYSLPEASLFNNVEPHRLNLEWTKSLASFYKEVFY